MTGQMHTFEYAYEREEGPIWVCTNCHEVRQHVIGRGDSNILNRGVHDKCDSGAVYFKHGEKFL